MKEKPSVTTIFCLLAILTWCLASCLNAQNLQLHNGRLLLSFDRENGTLVSLQDLTTSREFLNPNLEPGSPWEIDFLPDTGIEPLEVTAANSFTFSRPDSSILILKWLDFDSPGIADKELQITVRITFKKKEFTSAWKISIKGAAEKRIEKVIFPKVAGLKELGSEQLAVPVWMGQRMQNLRKHLAGLTGKVKKYEWAYPGPLSMQFLALYDPDKAGFYAAANDSLSYRKSLSVSLGSLNSLTYEMTNYPALDDDIHSYSPAYEAIVGLFKGDWITAARRYRRWGVRKRWSRNSRFKRGLTLTWLENTALWVWNRGESEKVLKPAMELKKQLGLPVSVLWHWWHHGPMTYCSRTISHREKAKSLLKKRLLRLGSRGSIRLST